MARPMIKRKAGEMYESKYSGLSSGTVSVSVPSVYCAGLCVGFPKIPTRGADSGRIYLFLVIQSMTGYLYDWSDNVML